MDAGLGAGVGDAGEAVLLGVGDCVGDVADGVDGLAQEDGVGGVVLGDVEAGEGVGAGVDGEEPVSLDNDGVLREQGICLGQWIEA